MKQLLGGMAMGAALVGAVWGLTSVLSDSAQAPASMAAAKPGGNKGVVDLICELSMDLDGQLALGITAWGSFQFRRQAQISWIWRCLLNALAGMGVLVAGLVLTEIGRAHV